VQPQFVPVVLAVDDAVLGVVPLDSAIKWRQLVYAMEGDFHHWLCAIAVTKKRVTLNFHFGALLDDPEGAFRAGSSKFMRMLDFESVEGVDAGLVGRRVRDAASRLDYFKANWQRIQREG
jgi:hypothetical protein